MAGTFCNQSFNPTRRPGKAEDGPPYGPPGMWSTFARHGSLEAAAAGMRRVFFPGDRTRDPEAYRIVEMNGKGREVAIHPVVDEAGRIAV